jgi:hypothetical protein
MTRAIALSLLVLGLLAAALVVPTRASATSPISIGDGGPAFVPAGDYLLKAAVFSTRPGVVELTQQVGGSGPALRVADMHVGTTATTMAAEVRVTGPSDVFRATPRAGLVLASLTLTPATWGYVVRGSQILAPRSNRPVQLRGINPALGIDTAALRATLAAYPAIKLVRIDVFEQCWETFFTAAQAAPECNEWDHGTVRGAAAYRARVSQMVNVVLATGRVALLGVDLPGDDVATFADGRSGDTVLPDQHTLAVYDDLVHLYGANTNVMFETMNEPKTYSWVTYPPNDTSGSSLWRDGGQVTIRGVTWTTPGVAQQVQRLRADGAINVIMIQGQDWGADLTPLEADPVDGSNLVLSFHAYNPGSTAPPEDLNRLVAPLIDPAGAYGYAGYMSEFGTQLQGSPGATYEKATIGWAATHGTGWAAWGWFPIGWGDQYALVNGFTGPSDAPVLLPKGATVVSSL